ncbi:MAG TPA: thioredoxin family protein [Coxiellaceae bacterium]|nr:thioredoxin family protein [Coxiellaceae bacterium]
MALTYSEMLPLATPAPDFKLPNVVSGKLESLSELKSPVATVICFICNHCPYVIHIKSELIKVARDYQNKGVHFIAINSNDTENYPQDGPEKMKAEAEDLHYPFPYLFDETQTVAKAYQAACTPDFYVFDKDLKCVYRGRFDESSPGNNVAVTGKDLITALDNLLQGTPINPEQKPSMGCNIKWKK